MKQQSKHFLTGLSTFESFFHLGLRRYLVFELKVGAAAPEHLGKLNFYVNAIDDVMRRPEHGDRPTIGILLAATRDDVVVEYALRGMDTPLAVSTYTTERALPEDSRTALPSAADLADVVRTASLPSRAPDRAPTSPWASPPSPEARSVGRRSQPA